MKISLEEHRKQATPESIVKRILRGDPVHYDEDYHCCLLIKIFIDGQGVAAFCGWNGMGERCFHEWVERYPAFAETYQSAKSLSKLWYERKAQQGLDDPSFNNTLWSMLMRNKFGYTEHRKIKIKGIDKASSFNEQIKCITEHIAKGMLTAAEVNQMASFVLASAKVDESTELKKDVEMLKGLQSGN